MLCIYSEPCGLAIVQHDERGTLQEAGWCNRLYRIIRD